MSEENNNNNSSKENGPADEDEQQETEPAKKRQKILKAIASDKPLTTLGTQMMAFIKKIIDSKIFPYAKFLATEKEVEGGYIQMVFLEMKWNTTSAEHHIKRARAWRFLVEYIIKRCADR